MSEETFLGFDFGEWKIGVAVGQTLTVTATGIRILKSPNKKPDWNAIEKLIHDWQPDALVVGIPYNMYDQEQAMTHAAKKFARQLHGRFKLTVYEADERLSSREAQNLVGTDKQIDDIAAQIILQSWLNDYVKNSKSSLI